MRKTPKYLVSYPWTRSESARGPLPMIRLSQRRLRQACLVPVLLAALLSPRPGQSASTLPTLGDGAEMSLGVERLVGERIVRELYRDPDYIDDPILADYVQSIWRPLLAAARVRGELPPELEDRFAWDVLLGRDRSINAFALPGGYLGLNLGLVGAVTQRDELASVLAHELSHVTQRHISRLMAQQSRQTPWVLGTMVLGILAASKSPEVANAMLVGGQAVAVQNQLNFSRDMEREADRIGFGVMTQAGFAPQGFVSMFEKLQQASRLNDNGSFPYLRSHPLTTERIADMQARQSLMPSLAPAAPDLVHAMMAARARVLTRPGVDVLRVWAHEPDQAGFPARSLAARVAGLYAAALAHAQLGDFSIARHQAQQLLDLAHEFEANPVQQLAVTHQAQLLIGDLALASGGTAELAQAASLLHGVIDGPTDRASRLMWAQIQIRMGQVAPALDQLEPWVVTHPRDASAWQALAAAWALQRQPLRAIRAEGEVQMALLDYAGAVDRFKAARELADRRGSADNHFEASIIDTRLQQAEGLLREQVRSEKAEPR